MHRDVKPENFLVKDTVEGAADWTAKVLKLIDFGSAKDLAQAPLTDYVGTRWYRAPELLLGGARYDQGVDVFAVGCIMAELYLGRPLFPGSNA